MKRRDFLKKAIGVVGAIALPATIDKAIAKPIEVIDVLPVQSDPQKRQKEFDEFKEGCFADLANIQPMNGNYFPHLKEKYRQ